MKRTAVFGGSFNPVHLGHLNLAKEILRQDLADEVWLMVSPHNPLKEQADLLDEQTRLRLTRLACTAVPGVFASDEEFSLPRPSYTWKTLDALRSKYPDRAFFLVIGGDNWQLFQRWARADYIIANYPIIVYPRPGYDLDEQVLPPSVRVLRSVPLFPYSSTEVRAALRSGADVSAMVPPEIEKAIKLEKLYGL
ncbi:MAG: nicotinate-nucleotide adenylyltransferase [Bacteroidales bacterium]|nr:nicotinate-nucleotide adenylyltransferase [Bacteroidales bacterium]